MPGCRAGVGSLSYLGLMTTVQRGRRSRSSLWSVLRRPTSRSRTVMICELCELTGGPFAAGEAAHLLEIHQQLHHGAIARHRPALPPVA